MESDEAESFEYPCGTIRKDPPPTYINAYDVSIECFNRMLKSLPATPINELLTTTTPSPYLGMPHQAMKSEYKDNV